MPTARQHMAVRVTNGRKLQSINSSQRHHLEGEHMSYTGNFMDLDPTYKDWLGDPLLRFTLNWRDNERNMSDFGNAKAVAMLRAMGAVETATDGRLQNNAGLTKPHTFRVGRRWGRVPKFGTQSLAAALAVSNLFVLGASSFPQNASGNPTLTILAQTYRTTEAIVERYLQRPGPIGG